MTKTRIKSDFIVVPGLEGPVLDNSILPLKHMLCIYYQLYFKKNQSKIQALIDSGNKINAMTLVYIKKLGFWSQKTDTKVQKIDSSSLTIYGMIIARF